MKKDLLSYEMHNGQYVNGTAQDVNSAYALFKRYDEENKFAIDGFVKAISMASPLPKNHIDIGSGLGWVIRKTSDIFEKVYAVEPSAQATEIASKALADRTNITYVNKDMVDAMDELSNIGPVFVTTAIVLSHITDEYVSTFLAKLGEVPNGSALFFDERYGKNIQWRLWHIRDKAWWANQLPDWQLSFFDIPNSGYMSGIFGIKVGKENRKDAYASSIGHKIAWTLQGAFYSVLGFVRKIMKKGV